MMLTFVAAAHYDGLHGPGKWGVKPGQIVHGFPRAASPDYSIAPQTSGVLRCGMNLVLTIPDDLAARMGAAGDVERQALEGLALEAYRRDQVSKAELRQWLGIGSRFALDDFLKAHDVYEPYTLEDLERERAAFRRLGL